MKVLIGSVIVAAILLMCMGCESLPECGVCCPVCEDCSEGVEDPYLCSKYYVEKEVLRMEARKSMEEIQLGSHDFFLKDPLVATKCLTCGIHFTHPAYGEHIKTCCP